LKITVAAASFSSEISGIQRHALNVVRCLLRRPEITRVDLVVAPWQEKLVQAVGILPDERLTTHVAEMDESSFSRNRWYYRELPALTYRLQSDLVHLSYPVPVNAGSFTCPVVLTLHDLYPYEIPRNFRFPQVIFNRYILQQCLRSVDAIACVSDTTMERMRQYTPSSIWKKAVRIHNCVEPDMHGAVRPSIAGWERGPFLLSVAQHRRNKNIILLIRAFSRLLREPNVDPDMKLLVVGIAGPETHRIRQLVSELGLDRSVLLLHGLSEPELHWCYEQCEALVVPSKTEGFGLPVAEALLFGCRIVCSDIAAFREIGSTDCRFVALGRGEEESLTSAIRAILKEPKREPISLPHLSVDSLANEYLHFYRKLIPLETSAIRPECSPSVFTGMPDREIFKATESSCVAKQEG
jgi:glycosyltransferase involved in cell wall biosynthesis